MNSTDVTTDQSASKLIALGLDDRAMLVYRAMVACEEAGVADLAEHLSISDGDVRNALEALAGASLARPAMGEPTRWRAVNPELELASLIARQEAELATQQQVLQQNRSVVADLLADYSTAAFRRGGGTNADFEEVSDVEEVRAKLRILSQQVRTEVFALVPGGPQSAEVLAASRVLDEETLRRGVRMRTVYLSSVRNDGPSVSYARWLSQQGGQIRTTESLPMRLLLIDHSVALIRVDPEQPGQGALFIRSPGVVAALYFLAENVWESSLPFGSPPVKDGFGLSTQERELLRLLAGGLTDAMSARRLGLSIRTVRRLMADLMKRINAASRFQAGLRLGQLGWCDADGNLPEPAHHD
ncbi:LuxR C-terminal-related transcriptional regulator [Streptomyces sp. NPDC088923]|uniref:LuxR C-terminal-related transcriptional regulator n=1 Tax=Streptomyces sp. NPDC088923 TaxID=3365913 RepID=UPI0037FD507E